MKIIIHFRIKEKLKHILIYHNSHNKKKYFNRNSQKILIIKLHKLQYYLLLNKITEEKAKLK